MKTERKPIQKPHTSRGFTLPEVMVSATILTVLLGIFINIFLDTSQIAFVSDERNQINRDIRTLTAEMSHYARSSNYFAIYPSFAEADRDEAEDQLLEGNSGDFLVLVYQGEPPNLQVLSIRPTTRIVGYYRAADAANQGPVRKFDIEIPASRQDLPLEELLPSASAINAYAQVIELSEGLANGRLFYNLWGTSVMINGKIIHGNAAKRVTDTYNFTVSPRGQQG
jgi:prepilin-type N-terminal cleavage/methylation domain-containing protein